MNSFYLSTSLATHATEMLPQNIYRFSPKEIQPCAHLHSPLKEVMSRDLSNTKNLSVFGLKIKYSYFSVFILSFFFSYCMRELLCLECRLNFALNKKGVSVSGPCAMV